MKLESPADQLTEGDFPGDKEMMEEWRDMGRASTNKRKLNFVNFTSVKFVTYFTDVER